MDWFNCKKKRLVKEVKSDNNLIESLIKSSDKKLRSQELLELTNDTASSKISLAYDSLRALLEALAIKEGYKIYNHECYTSFLKEVMNKSTLGDEFDKIRKTRNAINYYGEEVEKEEAKMILKEIKRLINKISNSL
ncbi:HEPN domain-containing protein [archaeon]|nr:HEPN domain-containing protein [archaeon]